MLSTHGLYIFKISTTWVSQHPCRLTHGAERQRISDLPRALQQIMVRVRVTTEEFLSPGPMLNPLGHAASPDIH